VSLKDYEEIVGREEIEVIEALTDRLKFLKLQEINSARWGGGVAEMLISYVPFLRNLGFDIIWSVIEAGEEFFKVTKSLHNFLQGEKGSFSLSKTKIYWETLERNRNIIEENRDIITLHDPQTLGLVEFISSKKVLWRCHVHLESLSISRMVEIKEFIKPLAEKCDAIILSTFKFLPLWKSLFFVIPPFIDPLSEKNKDLSSSEISSILEKYDIKLDKPLITQVSRFDWAKDPLGVIASFKKARERFPCQLLLVGGGASDDPEYQEVLERVKKEKDRDINILDLPPNSHKEINAFQRASSVIIQKSLREGFGLTVTEALWKGKPVIGGNTGGIPLQIIDGWNGFLVNNIDETADRIVYLLRNPKEAEEMGKRGKEYVRRHFLLPRGVKEHLFIMDQLVNGKITSKPTIISYHPWLGEPH